MCLWTRICKRVYQISTFHLEKSCCKLFMFFLLFQFPPPPPSPPGLQKKNVVSNQSCKLHKAFDLQPCFTMRNYLIDLPIGFVVSLLIAEPCYMILAVASMKPGWIMVESVLFVHGSFLWWDSFCVVHGCMESGILLCFAWCGRCGKRGTAEFLRT